MQPGVSWALLPSCRGVARNCWIGAPFHRLPQWPSSVAPVCRSAGSGHAVALSSFAPPSSVVAAANACTSSPSGSGTSITPKGLRIVPTVAFAAFGVVCEPGIMANLWVTAIGTPPEAYEFIEARRRIGNPPPAFRRPVRCRAAARPRHRLRRACMLEQSGRVAPRRTGSRG